MGYKMKGSPMQRNFGIGSPVKQTVSRISDTKGLDKKGNVRTVYTTDTKTGTTRAYTKTGKGKLGMDFTKTHIFNPKDLTKKTLKSVKTVSPKTNIGSKVVQFLKKGSKFFGGKALGVAGMMMATSSKADQPKSTKKSEGEQIRDLLTKHNLKGKR